MNHTEDERKKGAEETEEDYETVHVDPELSQASCPFCGYSNQVGVDVGGDNEDVCEHFADFSRNGFVFSKIRE